MRRSLAVAIAVLLLAPLSGRTATGPATRWGYIETNDGAQLRYTVVLPSADGVFPVALIWSVYTDGVGPTGGYPPAESPVIAEALLNAGYAILGVNMRGTGCSNGRWDLFQPASDGYEVVEWAAAQGWSTGDVGMFGFSAPGISQLLTAATHPPHLRAISPSNIAVDFYRDVAYPGGIPNVTFTGFWTLAARPAHEEASIPYAALQGDATCTAKIASKPVPSDYVDFVEMSQHPFDGELWDHYSPERILDEIDVPILTCQAMQDDQVSSHATGWLDHVDPTQAWTVLTNGPHGTCDDYTSPFTDLSVRFFDRYVRGSPNNFESEAHVQIWHETTHDGEAGTNTPRWVESHAAWPVAVEPAAFYLRAAGELSSSAPSGDEAADSYLYPLPSSSMESNEYAPSNAGWKIPQAPGGFAAYTSPPLAGDVNVFGPGSVDLWFASTVSDTDLQVTLTEIRPGGKEVFVQRGWLRASHRALDPARTTALRPYHSHLAEDSAPLPAGEAVPLRVELNPLFYTFRSGSRIRLYVEAPVGLTGLFGFDVLKTPAINRILHDQLHASKLVLGVVPGATAGASAPPCDTVSSQPCRRDPLAS
jgi:putative CocE/NonD family hydrolase